MDKVNIYWIDLFCGAGGTSTGIHLAGSKVIACVNHDKNAIAAHAANHPETIHFTEDIRDFNVVEKLRIIVEEIRLSDPFAIIAIWASLECTNFSKAKGGLPRDADSRTLAEHMFMYLQVLRPDYFWVENVREFMSWGPLDSKGKPESRTAGKDYVKWLQDVRAFGFRSDTKILNSANFGAYQSRERLFIQFAAKDYPIAWPEQTHTKDKKTSELFPMKKWKPVREVLDLQDEGQSIFSRKKELSENTLKRIYAGLEKFVAKGQKGFTKQYNSGSEHSRVKSFEEPIGSVTTENSHAIINTEHFIAKYFSGRPEGKVIGIDGPAGTVLTNDGQSLVSTSIFLNSYYGNGGVHNIDMPSPTVTTKDRIALIDTKFLVDYQYKSSAHSLDNPSPTLLTKDKFAKVDVVYCDPWIMNTNFNNVGRTINEPAATLTASRRHPYLVNANSSTCPPQSIDNPSPSITSRTHIIVNPSWYGHASSIDEPSVTIIARQDKSPLYLLAVENGPVAWIVFEDDSETMVKIKKFMVEYGITDIKMRMLKVSELLQIQGFPIGYKLHGNQTEQKKQIGNAVEVNQAKAITKTHKMALEKYFKMAA